MLMSIMTHNIDQKMERTFKCYIMYAESMNKMFSFVSSDPTVFLPATYFSDIPNITTSI